MLLKLRRLFVPFLAFQLLIPVAAAQVTGMYAFGPFDSPGFDSINRGNLNIHFTIPIFSKPGRGDSNFYYSLNYEGLVWRPKDSSGDQIWTPVAEWGWTDVTNVQYGYVTYTLTINDCTKNGLQLQNQTFAQFLFHDSKGNSHSIPYSYTTPCGNLGSPAGTGTYSLTDNSGYTVYRNGLTFTVFDKVGALYSVPQYIEGSTYQAHPRAASAQDTNGNLISASSSGVFTDTMGMTALTVSGVAPNPVVYTYTDPNGNHQTVTVNYQTHTVQTAFGVNGVTEYNQPNIPLVSSIVYSADGSSYSFSYEQTPGNSSAVTGRVGSITLRTGGTITYSYAGSNNGIVLDGTVAGLTRATSDGSVTYVRSNITSSQSTTTFTDASANATVSNYLLNSTGYFYETDSKSYAGSPSGTPLSELSTCYNTSQTSCTGNSVSSAFTSILRTFYLNGGSMGYDYQTLAGPELVQSDVDSSTGVTTYYDYNAYIGPYGITFYRAADSYSKVGAQMTGKTVYTYDGSTLTTTTGLPQHVAVSTPRANLTQMQQWLNSTGSPTIATSYAYDDAGQVRSKTDPNSSVTNYAYDSTDTLLTGVTYPLLNGIQLTQGVQPDLNTGLPLNSTDANSQITHFHYDGLLRATEVDNPDGGRTTIGYSTNQTSTYSYQNSSTHTDSEALYDGYGRLVRTAVANGQSANPWYQQDTCYDLNGRISFATYRYQGTGWGTGAICSGTGGDAYTYDALGRATKVQHGDSTTAQASYNLGTVQTIDESNVTRLTTRNLHGMVTGVCEISSNSTMPGSGAPAACNMDISGTGFKTTYAHSFLNHTVTVTQGVGVQSRVFQFDWVGRPTSVTEPESGITTYSYSYPTGAGLQVIRTRPAANQPSPSTLAHTTTQYDFLGRVSTITYDDGTPTKTFAYDVSAGWSSPAQSNLKGRLSLASVSSAQTIHSYDSMGRVTAQGECVPSNCGSGDFITGYSYDLAGNMLTFSDAFGPTYTYSYSQANEAQSIVSSWNDSNHPANLLSAVQEGPFGPLNWKLGSGPTALTAVRTYDTLGRVNGGWTCSGSSQPGCSGGTELYGFTSSWQGVRELGGCDTVLNQCNSYAYDEFNRLVSKTVTQGTAQNFNYVYDRWGNRWQQNKTAGSGPTPQLSFNTSTNQVQTSGYGYDAAGNMTSDGSHSYTYDAEGNITKVDVGSTASYTYDALNRRVRIDAGGGAEEYIFNAAGQHTSAWDPIHHWETAGWTHWGSTQLSFYFAGTTRFEHQDWTGTERARTNVSGQVAESFTSLPFGDNYAVGGGEGDWDPYHFSMLDQDSSSTEHAQFREYSNMAGRWMSPDPYSGSYEINNPQSMNRYSYSLNMPVSANDPQGLKIISLGGGANCDPGSRCPQVNFWGSGNVYGSFGDEFQWMETPFYVFGFGEMDLNIPLGSGAGPGYDYTTSIVNMSWGWGYGFETGLLLGSGTPPPGANGAPNNGTPPIGTPKTSAQCSIYQDGSATGAALSKICQAFPNGPKSNQIRGCLQSLYNPGSGYVPIPVIIPPTAPGGGTDLNSLLPGTGAHLGCFANAAGLL